MKGNWGSLLVALAMGWCVLAYAADPPAKGGAAKNEAPERPEPSTLAYEVPGNVLGELAKLQEMRLARRELELRYETTGRDGFKKKMEKLDEDLKLTMADLRTANDQACKPERSKVEKLKRQEAKLEDRLNKLEGKEKEAAVVEAELEQVSYELECAQQVLDAFSGLERGMEAAIKRTGKEKSLLESTGQTVPAISFTRVGAKEEESVDLGALAEKGPVAVAFWSLRNKGSLRTAAQMPGLVEAFAADGLTVVLVNLDDAEDAVITKQLGRLPAGLVVGKFDGLPVLKDYGLRLLPVVALIDKGGKVNSVFVGGSAKLKQDIKTALEIEKLAKEPRAEKKPAKGE
jgi:hypothetical protein